MAGKVGREREDHGNLFRRCICRYASNPVITMIFSEQFLVDETYQGKFDASYRGGSMVAQLEPTIFVSAMASVTKSVSFAITGSLSYIPVRISREIQEIMLTVSALFVSKTVFNPGSYNQWSIRMECRHFVDQRRCQCIWQEHRDCMISDMLKLRNIWTLYTRKSPLPHRNRK
jgi:hypothetical protein